MMVHLSHHAKMREGCVFPDDLIAAIANKAAWALSRVCPGHAMELPGSSGEVLKASGLSGRNRSAATAHYPGKSPECPDAGRCPERQSASVRVSACTMLGPVSGGPSNVMKA